MWKRLVELLPAMIVVAGCADGGQAANQSPYTVLPPGTAGTAGLASTAGVSGTAAGSAGRGGSVAMPPRGGAGMAGGVATGTAGMLGGGAGTTSVPGGNAGTSAPIAGTGAAGQPSTAGTSAPTTPGSSEPIIPTVSESCPEFRNGTITFMGLGGITVQAGAKASAATAPMIFYWHGTGSTAGEYAFMAGAVHQGAMQEGGVLISFQGTTGGDLLSGTAIFGAGDFELADQLLACAVQNHNIDPRRVFATGCSAGGLFSGAMAAARSNYMAAAAPNSGGWTTPVQFQNDWTPALMTIHGAPGADVVIIDFSDSSRTADMAFKQRGGFVINCNHGGGHCGGGGLAPDIWEFFKAHPYGTKPSPWAGGLPSGFNSDCEIF